MKSFLVFVAAIMLFAGCSNSSPSTPSESELISAVSVQPSEEDTSVVMALKSSGITGGVISPEYGMNGTEVEDGIPVRSLPLDISGAPEEAVCFAVYMDDEDSEPLCGFRWVHWMAVNIKDANIPDDFSRQVGAQAVQGLNDFAATGYGGPTPPDKDHTYVITVYALDSELPLSEGFTKDEFSEAIEGHVVTLAALEGIYRK